MRGTTWNLEDKLQAAIGYAITGTCKGAEEYSNIPHRTIRDWLDKEWFQELLAEARAEKQDELDGRWTGILHRASEKLFERLEKGDPYLTRQGTVEYVPVKVKDLTSALAFISDKRAMLRTGRKALEKKKENGTSLDMIADALAGPPLTDADKETEVN